MTPREIYKARICNAQASTAWKRGALDGVLQSAAGHSLPPLCPYVFADADDWHAGLTFGQHLYQVTQAVA